MRLNLKHLLVLLAAGLLLSACEPVPPESPALTTEWDQQVAAIAAGENSAARGAAIEARLGELGLHIEHQPFERNGQSGVNLLAAVSGAENAPLLLIGAHYDRVDVGRGVTDNASGSAAVLALAAALKQTPLQNHRVMVAFWDLEESGLLGSHHWAENTAMAPALYVNFDVFGWGDTIWMMMPEENMPIAHALRAAAAGSGVQTSIGSAYPPSDHLAFLQAKLPAVSFSLLAQAEIPLTLQVFSGERPDVIPKVMKVIHSPNDQLGQVVEADVVQALPIIEAALRRWDAGVQKSQ